MTSERHVRAEILSDHGQRQVDPGSHSDLVIDSEGNFLGSVSGGCVEGDVITEALDVIALGGQNILEFGVADETACAMTSC
jgi:xanthine/CO dehydrogenase XdhC/CoxF family maturation factor